MLPTIGLMVSVLGIAVCAYIALRALRFILELQNSPLRVVSAVVGLGALAAAATLGFLGVDLIAASTRTERSLSDAASALRSSASAFDPPPPARAEQHWCALPNGTNASLPPEQACASIGGSDTAP